jgi:glycosyltransferase involved in cell wall biosynthesis
MRICFYAPLKPPTSPVPSGDREMARHLCAALGRAGFTVDLASTLVSFDATGDAVRQAELRRLGGREAERVIARYRALSPGDRPRLWFTYHLYHKAPDWIGPAVAARLAIAYVVAEASHAAKQAQGPWAIGHAAAATALSAAARVFSFNPADDPGVMRVLASPEQLVRLPPFIDSRPFAEAARARAHHRARLAGDLGIATDQPWLFTAAMMRPGAKLASYRLLAAALVPLLGRRWQLLVAGDGPAATEVRALLSPLGRRVTFLGRVERERLCSLFAAADLYVWPAIGEAFGVAVIEAQAAGLPVVAGRGAGIATIVADGETGWLPEAGDVPAFAQAITSLLDDAGRRRRMAFAAALRARRRHDLTLASRRLRRHLLAVITASESLAACPAA